MGILTSDPYENAWIILGLAVATLIGAVIVIGGPAFLVATNLNAILCTGLLLISALIPLGLFSSGIIIDFINQSYEYSKASIVGVFGVIASALLGSQPVINLVKGIIGQISTMVAKSSTEVVAASGGGLLVDPYPAGYCDLPGFEWAKNGLAPPSVVLAQTIVWYHLIEDWDTGNAKHSILIGVTSFIVFLLQWLSLKMNNCLDSYVAGMFAPLVAYVLSIVVAGTSYGIVKRLPVSMPGGSTPSGPVKPKPSPTGLVCPKGYTLAPNGDCEPVLGPKGSRIIGPGGTEGIVVGDQQEKSLPVDDQDAFVCEAYKDGELVTSTIVE